MIKAWLRGLIDNIKVINFESDFIKTKTNSKIFLLHKKLGLITKVDDNEIKLLLIENKRLKLNEDKFFKWINNGEKYNLEN